MSAQPSNPLDQTTWSETQRSLIGPVFAGLLDGDLQPFADYLRAGLYVFPEMAATIADAIEGKDVRFRITARGTKTSQQKWSVEAAAKYKINEIGVFFEDLVRRNGKGGFESALIKTCAQYGISRGSAKSHRKALLDHLGDTSTVAAVARFEAIRQTYLGDRVRQLLPMNQMPEEQEPTIND